MRFLDGQQPTTDLTGAAAEQTGGFTGWDLFFCMLIGLAVTGLLVWITEYYTGTNYRPVRSIARASAREPAWCSTKVNGPVRDELYIPYSYGCFGGAATRIPLTTLGLLQYIAPTLQFLLGITVGDVTIEDSILGGPIAFDEKGDIKNGALTLYTFNGDKREQLAVVR